MEKTDKVSRLKREFKREVDKTVGGVSFVCLSQFAGNIDPKNLPSNPFPNSDYWFFDRDQRNRIHVFYNGRIGSLDIADAKKISEGGYSVSVVAKNISDAFCRDFVNEGARLEILEHNSSYGRVYDLVSDGINVAGFFDRYPGWRMEDVKLAERDARKHAKKHRDIGCAQFFVLGRLSPGKIDFVRQAGGHPVFDHNGNRICHGPQALEYELTGSPFVEGFDSSPSICDAFREIYSRKSVKKN